VIPFPSVPEVILEEGEEEKDDEEKENNLPLNLRTHLARATKLEWRRSSTITLPPIPKQPIQTTTSEDEMQQWIDEQDVEGNDVFKMSDFYFMPFGTKLVGDKIRDTLNNQPQQEDWSQFPPEPQGPKVAPSSPMQVTFCVDKGFVTPLPPKNEGEQVQMEQGEEPQQVPIDEVSEEGKICEYPQ